MAMQIMPGSTMDPAVFFVAWLRSAIESGKIDRAEWLMQVEAVRSSVCGLSLDAFNSSIIAIHEYAQSAGFVLPEDFPQQLSPSEYEALRTHYQCGNSSLAVAGGGGQGILAKAVSTPARSFLMSALLVAGASAGLYFALRPKKKRRALARRRRR